MDTKDWIEKTSYFGFYFALSISIFASMQEAAFVILGAPITIMTFLFPLLCLGAAVLIKRAGTLKG